jgi:hypothetical protein
MFPLYLFALVISTVKFNLIARETNMVLKPKILKWKFLKGSGKK